MNSWRILVERIRYASLIAVRMCHVNVVQRFLRCWSLIMFMFVFLGVPWINDIVFDPDDPSKIVASRLRGNHMQSIKQVSGVGVVSF